MSASLPDRLRQIVSDAHVLTDADMVAGYAVDFTRRWHGPAACVVRPADTDQVAGVLVACAAAGAAIIPQGGNTGLVGGSVPRAHLDRPQVVLSLARLREIEPVDAMVGEVTVGAGATLATVQAAARASRLAVGVDLGSRESATIGGMIATNAGGIQVLRHGPMREQLIGLEAVLADGTVVRRLPGLVKDNTGYHLPSLLAGSEGTLAVITRARLRLVPLLPRRCVALVAVDGADEAVALAADFRHRLPNLIAAELFFQEGMDLVLRHAGGSSPFPVRHPAFLLAEVEGRTDPTDELLDAIEANEALVRDAVLCTDESERERVWRLRERHTESVNAEGVPHKLDVAVPIQRLGEYAREVRRAIGEVAPEAQVYLYGHVGDGNLHVNVIGPPPEDESVDAAVLELAIRMGGSISAEHGIGVAKMPWLEEDRGPADLAVMQAIKRALDPADVLNPGVILPA